MYKINQGHLTVFCIIFVWPGSRRSPIGIIAQVQWFIYQNRLEPSGGIYHWYKCNRLLWLRVNVMCIDFDNLIGKFFLTYLTHNFKYFKEIHSLKPSLWNISTKNRPVWLGTGQQNSWKQGREQEASPLTKFVWITLREFSILLSY